jgi:hypothetical protein
MWTPAPGQGRPVRDDHRPRQPPNIVAYRSDARLGRRRRRRRGGGELRTEQYSLPGTRSCALSGPRARQSGLSLAAGWSVEGCLRRDRRDRQRIAAGVRRRCCRPVHVSGLPRNVNILGHEIRVAVRPYTGSELPPILATASAPAANCWTRSWMRCCTRSRTSASTCPGRRLSDCLRPQLHVFDDGHAGLSRAPRSSLRPSRRSCAISSPHRALTRANQQVLNEWLATAYQVSRS